jgi:hypothetical protein
MNLSETLRKYPGAAIITASEVVATGIAAKSTLEGNPMPVHDLLKLYSLMLYIGGSVGFVTQGVLHIVDYFKGEKSQFPQSPEFPQTPGLK